MANKIKYITLFLTVFLWGGVLQAQEEVNWKRLSDVTFAMKYNDLIEADYWYPTFGESVKVLAGKEIKITGYVIPVDISSEYLVLSSNPYSSCFFCGAAGPETVLELNLIKGHRKFKTDELLTFKGTLKLNEGNINHLNYILNNAEPIKE